MKAPISAINIQLRCSLQLSTIIPIALRRYQPWRALWIAPGRASRNSHAGSIDEYCKLASVGSAKRVVTPSWHEKRAVLRRRSDSGRIFKPDAKPRRQRYCEHVAR